MAQRVISLSSLDGTNGFQISGEAEEYSGYSVASAGDVNGDGFDDVIVGAPFADPNGTSSGASYVVFGRSGGFAAEIDLSALDGTDGFQISGEAASEFSGVSVASAGDVNGDGFDDLIIGASGASPHGNLSGASYVIFGTDAGFAAELDLASLDGTDGFQISGESVFDDSGSAVASAGDVNGDGFDDVIIGAPGTNYFAGVSYVVFGTDAGFAADLDLSTLDGGNGFQIDVGTSAYAYGGDAVASTGDVNGDGFDDLIVSAFGATTSNGTDSGASYVVFGTDEGFAATIDVAALDGADGFRIIGEMPYDYSGRSVASAGDVNGDGFADLVIGARGADPNGDRSGASYVVFGKAGGFAPTLDLSTLDGTNGFQLSGEGVIDLAGGSVASAGDVNGDGFDDVVIGAVGAFQAGIHFPGASYVVFGKAGGFAAEIDLASLDRRSTGFVITGENEDDHSGTAVASAGDVNGDGFDDVIVGVPSADPHGVSSGASYVVFGEATGAITRVGTAADEFFAGGRFKDSLSGAGGADRLIGGGGKDILDGAAGDDTLDGGAGRDRLSGGTDGDVLTGGADKDIFIFAPGAGDDRVLDFTDAGAPGDDRLDVSAYGFASFDDIGRSASGDDAILDFGIDTITLVDYLLGHALTDIRANDFIL